MVQLALTSPAPALRSREDVVAAALALGAASYGGPLSAAERALADQIRTSTLDAPGLRKAILGGADPLGDAICLASDLKARRDSGIFYTPGPIVEAMVERVLEKAPSRLVDPGCGSGRFAAQAARRDPGIEIVAIDTDPLATLACRAVLRTVGARSVTVLNADYTTVNLEPVSGRTAFVGNPPYVRHHRLTAGQKQRAKELAAQYGIALSGLSGSQVHFFFSTLALSKPGDIGSFITSAEWLDVQYGAGLRSLLMDGLGLVELELFDREAWAFQDVMTTALITSFEVGIKNEVIQVSPCVPAHYREPAEACQVQSVLLKHAKRWSPVLRRHGENPSADGPSAYVRLGDVVRVSRGVATGANSYFVMSRSRAQSLGLEAYTFPVLHEARQVFQSDGLVLASDTDEVLFDPPTAIELTAPEHERLLKYIRAGETLGVSQTHLASHRRPWWKVNSKSPPVVATYMARQPPAFARNPDGLRILNVIHGLYPRMPLSETQLKGLVAFLNANRPSFRGLGRTYQGGLEKFEPSEMEDLVVPHPERLSEFAGG